MLHCRPNSVPQGEGFRFVGEGTFEVHRTYRAAAFGAFAWSDIEGDSADGVPSTSTWEMSYVAGVKAYFPELDVFPGSSARWLQFAAVFGLPVNRLPGALFGIAWEPRIGMHVMAGGHWMKRKPDTSGTSPPLLGRESTIKPFVGVGFDLNIFTTLFGEIARIGGTF